MLDEKRRACNEPQFFFQALQSYLALIEKVPQKASGGSLHALRYLPNIG